LKEYAILIFPVSLVLFICIQGVILNFNPAIGLLISVFLLFSVVLILNIVLKRDLYKELNNFAC
jgi:hypothetical protein